MTQNEVTVEVFRLVRNFQSLPNRELLKKVKEEMPNMTDTQLQTALKNLTKKG